MFVMLFWKVEEAYDIKSVAVTVVDKKKSSRFRFFQRHLNAVPFAFHFCFN